MSQEIINYQQHIQELEKANRVLQKRWERSQKEQIRLEANHRKTQFLLRKVIQELEERQQKIAEQGQFLKHLWENVDYGIAVVEVINRGEEFRFIKVNPALSTIFSQTANICGKTFAEVFSGTLIEINRGRFRKCVQLQQNISFEECLEVNHRNYWWQIYLSPITDEQEEITKIIVTFTNISERKKTEQKLATLLSNLPGAAYSCQKESNWKTTFVSEGIFDLTGYYPKGFTDNHITFTQLTHPEDQDWVRQAVKDAIATCSQFNITYRLYTRTGEIKWVWERGQGIFSPDGELLAIDGFIADVTDRKLTENALWESKERFKRIASNVPGGLFQFITKPDGNIKYTYLSMGWQEITEIPYEEALADAQLVFQLLNPDDIDTFQQHLQRAIATGEAQPNEVRIHTSSGQLKWVRVAATPAFQANGDVIWDGMIMDVTERKLAEEKFREKSQLLEDTLKELQRTQAQIIQAEKMSSLGQLVAGIAHEINNPVNFIHGNLQHTDEYIRDFLDLINLYQQEYPSPSLKLSQKIAEIELDFLREDLPKLLTSMQVGTERIREIVKSLRIFSRLDEAEIKTVDIHEGIESTLMILYNRLKAKPHRMEIEVIKNYGDVPPIECYAGQLNQVFMNILANAIDALEEGMVQQKLQAKPQITIRTSHFEQQFVEIAIADNGVGIPADIQPRIFDPFFTTKPVGKGTGMGMSISYQIITDKHQGQLECFSTPETGTKFIIKIPIAAISRTDD